MASVSDGKEAVVMQMGNKAPLDDKSKEEQIISGALFSELGLSELGAKLKLESVEKINGKDAYGVSVTLPQGGAYTVYFDAESGLKVKYSKALETPQGQFTQTISYSDYKEVNGVMFPHKMVQSVGPQVITMTVDEIKVNQELPEGTFAVE